MKQHTQTNDLAIVDKFFCVCLRAKFIEINKKIKTFFSFRAHVAHESVFLNNLCMERLQFFQWLLSLDEIK